MPLCKQIYRAKQGTHIRTWKVDPPMKQDIHGFSLEQITNRKFVKMIVQGIEFFNKKSQ
jgi:hypothetical protein